MRQREGVCVCLCVCAHVSDIQSSTDELAQHASTEHAQLQKLAQVAMETLQQEKSELQTQLQSQVSQWVKDGLCC